MSVSIPCEHVPGAQLARTCGDTDTSHRAISVEEKKRMWQLLKAELLFRVQDTRHEDVTVLNEKLNEKSEALTYALAENEDLKAALAEMEDTIAGLHRRLYAHEMNEWEEIRKLIQEEVVQIEA